MSCQLQIIPYHVSIETTEHDTQQRDKVDFSLACDELSNIDAYELGLEAKFGFLTAARGLAPPNRMALIREPVGLNWFVLTLDIVG
jgi:hypothetical protein